MSSKAANNKTVNEAETKLLESAMTLFSDKGYEGTSIREIIEGAGVTRPVLYYYFENKEDLFRRIVEQKFAEYTGEIRDVLERLKSCRERLQVLISKAFELAERNPEAVHLILQVFFSPPQQGPPMDRIYLARQRFRLLEQIMREGLENHELSGGDSQSLALVFQGIMDMHIMAKSNRPETRLTPELAEGLVDLFLHGCKYRDIPVTALESPYSFTA